ncbi:MAG: o-succinylbenzoate synthase [Chloroflexi bacterium]|nr:o-succinylbenzoate synthase [Chloroflexota bacterium]MBP8054275.1 o-succinylbenzoate synthase [Chloroflexota bacterium]
MKIQALDLYHISMPLVSPFQTSFGTETERECLIVALHSEGLTGWGECVASPFPGYSYETIGTAWHLLTDIMIPMILGQELQEPGDLEEWLKSIRGHPLAKAALEQAVWDITAQRDGLSLAQKLAQPYAEGPRGRVKVGVSIGIQPRIERTLEMIQEYVDQGYRRIKLKIKPGHDIELARRARETFPNLPIMLDANSAYRLEDVATFKAMDDLNLLMLEQPLGYEDIYDHSRLRPRIITPICLDESIHSADHARYALAIGACDIINIKPARVSGWLEARRIHDLCYQNGVPVWCGGMLETGIGRAAQLALASLPGFTLPGDISATERYYTHDIATPFHLNAEDSTLTVPTGPGLGIEVDHHQLTAVTRRKETFR